MKRHVLAAAALTFGLAMPALAGDIDIGGVVGGAVGGGVGAGVGSKVGGTTGAVIGGALGGATGAAIGSSVTKDKEPEKVVVKERVVEKEVRVVEVEKRAGPPGTAKARRRAGRNITTIELAQAPGGLESARCAARASPWRL